jgi:sugar lactone lactonase YvrE
MTTNRTAALVGGLTLGLAAGAASAEELSLVWQTDGLQQPESAVFDTEREVFYVSNVAGGPMDRNGEGHISRVGPEGELLEADWVTGLDAPKGLALAEGMLYVADIDRLVAIDVEEGAIAQTYEAQGAEFLNDVTADDQGRIYVSDMMANTIWRLDGDQFEVWVEDEALEQPNGLLAESDRIVVGSWGVMTDGFETETPGHLKVVDLETGEVQSLGDGTPVGNLDGVEPDGQGGYLVTDWMAGALLRIDESGKFEQLLDLNQGSADHTVLEDQRLVVIPMMNDDQLLAYRLD